MSTALIHNFLWWKL